MSTSRPDGVSRVKTETFEYHIELKDFNQLKIRRACPETFKFAGGADEDKAFCLKISFPLRVQHSQLHRLKFTNILEAYVELKTNFKYDTVFLKLGLLFDNKEGQEGKYSGKVMLPDKRLIQSSRDKQCYCLSTDLTTIDTISSGTPTPTHLIGYHDPITDPMKEMNLTKCNFLRDNVLRIVCLVEFRIVVIDYNIRPQLNLAEEEYSFVDLLESGDMSDITVVCGEKTFSCHSAILGGKSPVFKAMLNNSCLEKETRQIVIEGMEAKTLEVLLTYCYGGKPSGDFGDDTVNVFLAADQYDIQPLKRRCEKLLVEKEDSLSVDSCLKLLAIADLHSADLLMSAGMRFLAKNAKEVMDLPTWDQFLTDHPHLVNRIMREISRR